LIRKKQKSFCNPALGHGICGGAGMFTWEAVHLFFKKELSLLLTEEKFRGFYVNQVFTLRRGFGGGSAFCGTGG
jgi:hypothetical protein